MKLLLLIYATLSMGVCLQDGATSDAPKADAEKPYVLSITEIKLLPNLPNPPSAEEIAANYRKYRRGEVCEELQLIQVTLWPGRRYEFTQMKDLALLDRVTDKGSRIMTPYKVGLQLLSTLTITEGEAKLKLNYENAYIENPSPDSKPSDVITTDVKVERTVSLKKGLILKADADGKRLVLINLILPIPPESH